MIFGGDVLDSVVGHAHAVGLALALAKMGDKVAIAAAGRHFAALVDEARLSDLGRFMASAATRAMNIHSLSGKTELRPTVIKPEGNVTLAELKCDGLPSVCQSGGSYGDGAMYRLFGRNLCRDCAVKSLGVEEETGAAQSEALRRFLIKA